MKTNIEYISETHQYLINGKLVPSVTQIVAWKFDLYKDIPDFVLQKAAEYGTKVHELCEKLATNEITLNDLPKDKNVVSACYDFKQLMSNYCFYPKSMEQIVNYKNKVCGQYDILTEDDILIDIKTTSKIHVDNITKQAPLNLQMSIYALALGIHDCYYIHLPKGKKASCGRVELWDEWQVKEVIDEYIKEHTPIN